VSSTALNILRLVSRAQAVGNIDTQTVQTSELPSLEEAESGGAVARSVNATGTLGVRRSSAEDARVESP